MEGRSFLAVAGGSAASALAQVPCLELLPCPEMMSVLNGSFVGVLRQHREARLIQHCFVKEGLEEISVTDMGAQLVLLRAEKGSVIAAAREKHREWWDDLFVDTKLWTPNLVSKKRTVWLRVLGIPLHFWEDSLFKKIGAVFGDFLDFDDGTICRPRLDAAFIKVVIERRSFIDDFMKLRVVGAEFGLWVAEVGGLPVLGMVVEERWWEVESSDDSRGEEVVGSSFSESEEEEAILVQSVQLEAVVGRPTLESTGLEKGQEGDGGVDEWRWRLDPESMGFSRLDPLTRNC